ncbi:hypothetical protein [Ralstonia pseudosolanacearum]|uniref:hypothetical protein n=1 Tax=Ralstonia pseudosolanacearum TaxID=1310165 RepID=UPI001FFA4124|nr:hypothetical protein [Ralstonia pseudosolanacearum]
MREYQPRTVQALAACICDRCKHRLTPDDGEWQERLSFDQSCGFDSVFGDGNTVSLDLCQHCVREVLGQWLRVELPESEREINAMAERVMTSTKEASDALDSALSSVSESNMRIATMADDGGPATLTQLKGVIRKPTKPVSVGNMSTAIAEAAEHPKHAKPSGKRKPKKQP